MRTLRIALIFILVAVTALFGVTKISQLRNTAGEAPVITCSDEVLELSVKDSKTALLSGVTASDAQDGDLTANILVSGISKFTDIATSTANVTYMVFDSDGNMGSFTRPIRYTDYTAPRFTLTEPLNYKTSEEIALLDRLHALDCIDGDISGSIRVSSMMPTTTEEIYSLTVQVTNSMGDSAELDVELFCQYDNLDRPVIKLNNYLLYLSVGSSFDPSDYLSYAESSEGIVSKTLVDIDSNVDTENPGTYFVHYSYSDGTLLGRSVLTVVVE